MKNDTLCYTERKLRRPVNHLRFEKSPYLKQHASNPVDWYPWGDEAIQLAKKLDKPIFLSIGYATCHWCHVMEQESFENGEIGALLNRIFVSIKVDREELPQVDALYMEFGQAMMEGRGGWPLNLVLTPDLKPIFAATYLPPTSRPGLLGLVDLCNRVEELWNSDERETWLLQADHVVEIFKNLERPIENTVPSINFVREGAEWLFRASDSVHGGLQGTPKFPIPLHCLFLLNFAAIEGDGRALFLAEKTLQMMAQGGIFDHLGGGFARYSVDAEWKIPHFEKMLYDNAQLAEAYTLAWKQTHHSLYKEVALSVFHYLLRDMHDSQGGFYSAEDADSEGEEGRFYTWSYNEIVVLLNESIKSLFLEFYSITKEGSFYGLNVLHQTCSLREFAEKKNLSFEDLKIEFANEREKLRKIRTTRKAPFKDTKIVTSWNAILIHSLAYAGRLFQDNSLNEAAVKAALFIFDHLFQENTLLRRWCEGEAKHPGVLDDYVFLLKGCLSLFEMGHGTEWLEKALHLHHLIDTKFRSKDGLYYFTEEKTSHLIIRNLLLTDGAEPSANAAHLENLLRLFAITGNPYFFVQAESLLKALTSSQRAYPPGYIFSLGMLLRYHTKQKATLVVAYKTLSKEAEKEVYRLQGPFDTIIWKKEGDDALIRLAPWTESYIATSTSMVYKCYEGACEAPFPLPD